MDKKYIAPCGLNCYDCLFYKNEIYETAQKLKGLIKDSQLDTFLGIISERESYGAMAAHLGEKEENFGKYFGKFEKIGEFMEMLDGIIDIQCTKTCREEEGCSMCGSAKECEALKCLKERGYEGCWECDENSGCSKLIFQKRCYGESVEGNLKIAKESGIEAVPSRGDNYYEWQRRLKNIK